MKKYTGIGFRKDFAEDFLGGNTLDPAFIEVAPENWMGIGGYWKKIFKKATERYPLSLHGLSLSIGGPDELDRCFLEELKQFIREYGAESYSEHLSFSKCDNAHLYDLLPVPFRRDAVRHIVERIQQVQDFLGMRIGMEIVSYYTPIDAEMEEHEFISNIVERSGCELLLDVNNVYVNGFNHGYDPYAFIEKLPLDRVTYIHMAGHEKVSEDLIIDTHGQPIISPVYKLFDFAVSKLSGPVPVLLERDFNIPSLPELQQELDQLEATCQKHWSHESIEQ